MEKWAAANAPYAKCHLLQLHCCCSSAACQQPALRGRPHVHFIKSNTSIKNSRSPSNIKEFNSSLNHLRGSSGSTHFRIEDGNCYTILCHFLLSLSFRSSSWQLTHIQERWEEEGSNHHACSLLFISKFCGTLSLTTLLWWSSARLWQIALLTEPRGSCTSNASSSQHWLLLLTLQGLAHQGRVKRPFCFCRGSMAAAAAILQCGTCAPQGPQGSQHSLCHCSSKCSTKTAHSCVKYCTQAFQLIDLVLI